MGRDNGARGVMRRLDEHARTHHVILRETVSTFDLRRRQVAILSAEPQFDAEVRT
jgi:hypothetical protein